jgi:hypothetical protein
MPISKLEEDMLVKEIGKLAGFFGGIGARMAARRLPVEEYEVSAYLSVSIAEARAKSIRVLQHLDARLEFGFTSDEDAGGISAIMGSGHLNLNPTIIRMRFIEKSPEATNVLIRALAKEGIIKQHSAEKAGERINNLLQNENT